MIYFILCHQEAMNDQSGVLDFWVQQHVKGECSGRLEDLSGDSHSGQGKRWQGPEPSRVLRNTWWCKWKVCPFPVFFGLNSFWEFSMWSEWDVGWHIPLHCKSWLDSFSTEEAPHCPHCWSQLLFVPVSQMSLLPSFYWAALQLWPARFMLIILMHFCW